ncbi:MULTISPECIES: AMP-binding protein [Ramlibacter]|uniref:AMP-binding protein n=1 Tax=Ramlibacter aquaticus TaxID=2780094 RepID=A0ABR9SCX4_9BURK|nr:MULTISPECIES: AMP-binding protein [Ramlibacter]MBE7939709.1 AMP-binding protein [Ramlibacter aquaticus]
MLAPHRSPESRVRAPAAPWAARERAGSREAKKDALLLAAARLFTSQGFQGTSVDDIARSLGVTKPTLYYYIDCKEDILFGCLERGLAAFHQGLAALDAAGLVGRERLLAAVTLYAEVVTGDFGQCVIRVGEDPLPDERRRALRAGRRQVDEAFRDMIGQGMAQGWIAPGDAAVAAFTVVGAISGIGRWYRPGQHSPKALEDAIRHGVDMLSRGVLSAPGLRTASSPSSPELQMPQTRRETHFGDRFVRCYAERPRNLARMLSSALERSPEATALVFGPLRLCWRELHHAASCCAGGLHASGVRPGDRVAVHMGNCAEFVVLALACAWMGAVLVPVSARARGVELTYAIENSGAVVLASAPDLADLVDDSPAFAGVRLRLVTGAQAARGFVAMSQFMQAPPLLQPHDAQEEDLAVLLYTSGTTGRPKGAMISHLNVVHSVMHYQQVMGLGEEERTLVAVPLSHVTGLVAQLYLALHCRAAIVLMEAFKAADFLRLAQDERITHTIMVPAMYNLCLLRADFASHDLRHWRIGAYGGAPMPTATIEGIAQRLPDLVLMNAYGATETCSPATIMPRGQTAAQSDSVGQVVPCGEISIVDEHGREVPPGDVGEVWIAGPMVVQGYWQNPEATASEFRGGFWRSGDIGSRDAQGYVRILDRKKDVINRGGYKVFCATVENVLSEHPAVLEAALVGVPCSVLGERVHAFVTVTALDEHTQAKALQAFCTGRIADYAVPETWTIDTAPLPRNLNGKIVKRELRQSLHAALM